MVTQVTGTVIGGRLELDEPILLPDNSRVRVEVRSAEIPPDWRERMQRGLEDLDRLMREHPIRGGGLPFTREQLHERR